MLTVYGNGYTYTYYKGKLLSIRKDNWTMQINYI